MTSITLKINGKPYEVTGRYGPDVSLNEYIRNVADLRGTKVMCQEGGCGACVVAVRAPLPPTNEVKLFAVNSCLVSVLSCHDWEVVTAEGIGNRTLGYHEIQQRLANFNGTQCGYCTPGWVMNMYSLHESKNKNLTSLEVENSFAGNMCRCTGYRPIADAFKSFATDADESLLTKLADMEDLGFFKRCGVKCNKKCEHARKCNEEREMGEDEWCLLNNNQNKMITVDCGTHKWYKTYTMDDVFKAMGAEGDYKLIAGNTGQGVYHVTEYPKNVIDIFNVSELKGYSLDVNLILGAGMPLNEMMEVFLKLAGDREEFAYLKQLHEHMDLVAHIPVRNIGTIGGNLFLKHTNREFQSDVFLLFETVGAMMTIADDANRKIITLPEFLDLDMKKKIIFSILLPPLSHSSVIKTYKIMPRSQNAHAVVNAGFHFKFKQNSEMLERATVVYGSIYPSFIHATQTETFLAGKSPYTNETLQSALKILHDELKAEEAQPEPSGSYRKMLGVALFYKAILNICPESKMNPKFKSGGDVIKRSTSKGAQVFDTDKSLWPLNQPIPKLEALVQCSGESVFANDLPTQIGEVFAAFVLADAPPGSVISDFDASEALKIPGVIAFYSAKDIPGDNNFTPLNVPLVAVVEEVLCSKNVLFNGQPAAIIVADREKTANRAAKLVKIKYASVSKNQPLIDMIDVLKSPEKDKRIHNDANVEPTDAGNNIKTKITGEMFIEGQYHYTMETQTCVVKPTEDGMEVYSSTQWVDMVHVAVAQCLKIPLHKVNVIVRRVGGGYGSKISRATQVACASALVSHLQGKVCRFVLPLQVNMKIVGKRLPTYVKFEVAVDTNGQIQYLKNNYYQDNGCSPNETISPLTINHFYNCYDSKRWSITANSIYTDTPSNTWCRAPASTEGVAMIENIMEQIAFCIGKDAIEVRLQNMKTEDNAIPELIEQIKKDSEYDNRVVEIKNFNDNNRWRKRAMKLVPMTYEVNFFGPFNSLISIYHGDGSVIITHAGIEMGQGINTKVAQVCAYELGIPMDKISVKPTQSLTSPNAMVTGGSIGSECVAYATIKACNILKDRLKPVREAMDNPAWEVLIEKAFQQGVELHASALYTTNDKDVKSYDIYGVAVLEVEVDVLTGNHDVRRVDLLEDTGRSMNPEIDVAQIEGAFVMGLGYWTSEKLVFDHKTGELLTDRTWTYKPPGLKDIPADFRVYFRRNGSNPNGVLQSKATGEPALCLAVVVTHAIREAVRACRLDAGYPDQWLDIQYPYTVENIFMAAEHKLEHFVLK